MPDLDEVIAAIDRLHEEDPAGQELGYARDMTRWLEALVPDPDPLLAIAVRAQHLKRWECPRSDFPQGRKGYLSWRRAAAEHHARLAEGVLAEAGFSGASIDRVAGLVLKRGLDSDPEAQMLEDCACLVFLEKRASEFAAQHPRPKVDRILQKTLAKMSPEARRLADEFVEP